MGDDMSYMAYKRHLRRIRRNCGLYAILIDKLEKLPKARRSGVIRFPDVFMMLCSRFHISKQQAWDLLLFLHEFRVIRLVPYHGIKIMHR